eukprot:5995711-Pyramimonas_sp.AAC.1
MPAAREPAQGRSEGSGPTGWRSRWCSTWSITRHARGLHHGEAPAWRGDQPRLQAEGQRHGHGARR